MESSESPDPHCRLTVTDCRPGSHATEAMHCYAMSSFTNASTASRATKNKTPLIKHVSWAAQRAPILAREIFEQSFAPLSNKAIEWIRKTFKAFPHILRENRV